MAEEARNRRVALDPAWILPLTPPPGVGIVTPSCTDRTDVLAVPIRTGQGLRIGGEASLCWRCGPGGSVYHPDAGYSMADVRREADLLVELPGLLVPHAEAAHPGVDFQVDCDGPADLLRPAPLPEAFLHEDPAYVTWTPQIHRAPRMAAP